MSDRLKPLSVSLPAAIGKLERQARAASDLAAAVRAKLPEELRPHVLTATRRGDQLVLTVDSAAWATRVRYSGTRLKEALAPAGQPAIAKIRVRVRGR
jgi:hypothetical protein